MKTLALSLTAALLSIAPAAHALDIIDFDHLSSEQGVDSLSLLSASNGGSSVVDGVTFDANTLVVGNGAGATYYGGHYNTAHSDDYAITNGNGVMDLTLTTTRKLTGLWACQLTNDDKHNPNPVTIEALKGSIIIDTVTVSPLGNNMEFTDTSKFSSDQGVTGYVFHQAGGNDSFYLVDDLNFTSAPSNTPEPGSVATLAGMAMSGAGMLWKRRGPAR